jgi:hypothetical protein
VRIDPHHTPPSNPSPAGTLWLRYADRYYESYSVPFPQVKGGERQRWHLGRLLVLLLKLIGWLLRLLSRLLSLLLNLV